MKKTARAIADELYEARLSPEEFDARLEQVRASMQGPEGDEIREQIAWFLRRYPNPLDRLAYARRKFKEAEQMRGIAFANSGERSK